ncbi:MAG: 4-(cytidine 5'-diphospho)-2-C-methyl-D-erythritol kinase [Ruminococcaceae bacterium]|nr:4-(cytidine 5'-diphospho)-2-C-methyl-D-erythritol kinase [Oscillospiraceae bacterium]
MNEIFEKAYAKVNISLDVLGLLPNGYHEMRMIMQSVSLCDDISISLNGTGHISCQSDAAFLPNDEGNIAVRATKKFFSAAAMENTGADIRITKRIPTCAGMGGGSSDGAAVLRGLNRLCGNRFSRVELEAIAASVGSDIPFCVAGGTQLATGTGTTLEDLPPLPDCFFVICKPSFAIRTPELFAKIDSRRSRLHPDTAGMLSSLNSASLEGVVCRMYNVFEDVLPRSCADIARLKSRLLDFGALGSVMTGTGSALFGIFESEALAEKAFQQLKNECPECYLAKPVRKLMD